MSTTQSRSSRAPKRNQRKSDTFSASGRAPRHLQTVPCSRNRSSVQDGTVSLPHHETSITLKSLGGPAPTGVIHAPRRGIFYASELLHSKDSKEYEKEFGDLERSCIIRFPPQVAAILRERLAIQSEMEMLGVEHQDESGELIEYSAGELGFTITPTAKEDYRVFDVEVERELGVPNSAILLTGVLVELPCILEAYKSLEGELLFKSADISQMLYVFDSTTGPPFNLSKIRDDQCWEWHSGLTPGTHRIRSRKFKNFRVFDRQDVSITEREINDIVNQRSHREQAYLEASTEDVCEQHLEALQLGTLESNVVGIIGPENPILQAALDGTSTSTTIKSGKCENMGSTLLRHLLDKDNSESGLMERARFSVDLNMNVTDDEIIADDLSDRLFGDFGEEQDEIEDYQLDEISGTNADQDASSSESSLLSDDEDLRKKSKKASNNSANSTNRGSAV